MSLCRIEKGWLEGGNIEKMIGVLMLWVEASLVNIYLDLVPGFKDLIPFEEGFTGDFRVAFWCR